MRNTAAAALIALIYLFSPLESAHAQRSKKAKSKYVIDDWTLFPIQRVSVPQKGKGVVDPSFGTRIVRVTDRNVDRYDRRSKKRAGLVNNYARYDCDSAQSRYILLRNHYGSPTWHLYDGQSFKYLKSLPLPSSGAEPLWDWEDPKMLYFLEKTRLMVMDVQTEKKTLIRDFARDIPGATRISTQDEGTPSVDARKWAFQTSGKPYWIWYDRQTKMVKTRPNAPSSDSVSASPLGDTFGIIGDRRNPGIWMTRGNLHDLQQLNAKGEHADYAIDRNGNEVFVYYKSHKGAFEMVDLKSGKKTKLMSIWHHTSRKAASGKVHFSGNCIATPGWILVSTYGGKPYEVNAWYDQSVCMLELKENPRIWRIAHTHCPWDDSKGKDYVAEAFATINMEGTRIYWGTTWDRPYGARTIETVFVELPKNWYTDLMGKAGARRARRKTLNRITADLGRKAANVYKRLTAQ